MRNRRRIDPIKGLGKYVAFGLAGAVLLGLGVMFIAIGVLRVLQGDAGDPHFTGNWSWAPYAIVVVGSFGFAGDRLVRGYQGEHEEEEVMSANEGAGTRKRARSRGPTSRPSSVSSGARSTTGPRPSRCPPSRWPSAAVVVTIVAAYWFGKRKGKKRQLVLEIRRI